MFDEKKNSNFSSLKPAAPKNIQKYIIDVFFSDENDDGVSLPLFAQEEAENSKNRKIEKPL